jgi:hypothetical protein
MQIVEDPNVRLGTRVLATLDCLHETWQVARRLILKIKLGSARFLARNSAKWMPAQRIQGDPRRSLF